MSPPLWSPSPDYIENTLLYKFQKEIESKYRQNFSDYQDLWRWSVENAPDFWTQVWDFCGVIGEKGKKTFDDASGVTQKARFFTDSKLNYAENLLRGSGDAPAIIFRDEHGKETNSAPAGGCREGITGGLTSPVDWFYSTGERGNRGNSPDLYTP